MTKNSLWRLLAALLALSLLAAACGNDSDGDGDTGGDDAADTAGDDADTGGDDAADTAGDDADTDGDDAADGDDGDDEMADDEMAEDEATDEAAGDDPFAGCGDQAETDIADESADREVARCDPGYPAPIPLAETTTVSMSSSFRLEFIAPILLAEHYGEFEKENIEFEFISSPFSEAQGQLGTGDIDFAVGGTEASLFNSIDNGFELKWAVANFFPPSAGDTSVPQTGLWARADAFADPSNPDIAELAGTTMASAVGLASSIAYPIGKAFEGSGVTLGTDVSIQTIPSADMVQALENDAVQSAWMLDPLWQPLAESDDYVLVATQTPGEPIGGLYSGPSCASEKRDACVAFLRAMIRTINTYLTGDYHADADVVEAIAEETDGDAEVIAATPSLLFDWEIREGTTDRIQEIFIGFSEIGEPVVEFDTPFPEDQVVDRSMYLEAVGRG